MTDNIAITAGSGTSVAADDIGSVFYQRVKVTFGVDGVATDVSATNPLPIVAYTPVKLAAASAMTRPANTTAYAANDAVSNNATAGSVTAISFTAADLNDAPLTILRIRINSTDTGFAAKDVQVWLFRSDPTASSGITGGDNAAFSVKKTTDFLGTFTANMVTFSDGSVGLATPDQGSVVLAAPTSGAQTLYAVLKTLTAATPSANSTTFTLTLEGYQDRAA